MAKEAIAQIVGDFFADPLRRHGAEITRYRRKDGDDHDRDSDLDQPAVLPGGDATIDERADEQRLEE
jgi:hypothetical protein